MSRSDRFPLKPTRENQNIVLSKYHWGRPCRSHVFLAVVQGPSSISLRTINSCHVPKTNFEFRLRGVSFKPPPPPPPRLPLVESQKLKGRPLARDQTGFAREEFVAGFMPVGLLHGSTFQLDVMESICGSDCEMFGDCKIWVSLFFGVGLLWWQRETKRNTEI